MFQFLTQKRRRDGLVGVHFCDSGVAVAIRRGELEPRVEIAYQPVSERRQSAEALSSLVKRHHLQGMRCVSVLEPGAYQLNQVRAPAVEAAELRAAIRWRIKEFIDYPIDDAVVDCFEVPSARSASSERMLFAVSARSKLVKDAAEWVRASGLDLQAVDIAELALRNLSAHVSEQGGGLALLALGARSRLITICRGDTLYLARTLEFGSEQLAQTPAVVQDSLVLEIQRSLDYYESQLSAAPASRILVAPMGPAREALVDQLNQRMGIAAFGLDCAQLLELEQPCPSELQTRAVLAVGAALRSEAA